MNRYMPLSPAGIAGYCLVLSGVFISPIANAFPAITRLPIDVQIASDQTLSHIVGRGVIGGTIVYFGVEMQTNWTSGSSQTPMSSTMNVALNSAGNVFVPTVTYSMKGSLPQISSPENTKIASSGLNNIQGVTQAIQIAGQNNSIQNGMSLNVINGAPSVTLSGSTLTPGTHALNNTTTMTVQPGQLSMALNNGGAIIRQGIGSTGLFQTSQVGSNLNKIQNQMTLTLGVNPNKTETQNLGQLQSIIGSLHNLPSTP